MESVDKALVCPHCGQRCYPMDDVCLQCGSLIKQRPSHDSGDMNVGVPSDWTVKTLPGVTELQHSRSYLFGKQSLAAVMTFLLAAGCVLFFQGAGSTAVPGGVLCALGAIASLLALLDTTLGVTVWRLSANRLEIVHMLCGYRRVRRFQDCTIQIHWKYPAQQHGAVTARPLDDRIIVVLISNSIRSPIYGYNPPSTGNFADARKSALGFVNYLCQHTGWELQDNAVLD